MSFLALNAERFPCVTPEDDTLCRRYRDELELEFGFKWAPLDVASAFSFEREPKHPTFGFHGLFNLPHVLGGKRLAQRLSLANAYVRGKPEWREVEAQVNG